MAVAWFRNPVLEEGAPVIDRSAVNERTFGVAESKRHPAYVYSVNKNACLMHKIIRVTIHFYAIVGMHKLGRLKQPAMIAHTACGCSWSLRPERSRTCHVPLPDSVLCGRCHGKGPTFRRSGDGRKRREAAVKLGCVVAGYPSSLESGVRVKG